ncbi:MAG TPA: gamma-glutamyl-gamma-aminobutyrate hydrolase family protein [Bryobacteraceae bacterium]|nr:gamma-glutamyl-gamma-aminobutyrate hydrolase family protein [Bryobacteraceae bacterium]
MSAQRNSRRVVAFRHVPFEGAGLIAPVLEARGLCLEYVDLYGGTEASNTTSPEATSSARKCVPMSRGGPLGTAGTSARATLAEAAGLIFLGGPMSVNDPLPYLRLESEILTQAIGRGQPVLGICLGSQLIAQALGSRVYRNPVKEIGWFDLRLTDAGRNDRLFGAMNPTETVFHWHGETFDLPAGAVRLAHSDACANQAFRVGTKVYGLQFHLEVTPAMIADWCRQDENCGGARELDGPIDPERNRGRLAQLAERVFGNWCDLLGD